MWLPGMATVPFNELLRRGRFRARLDGYQCPATLELALVKTRIFLGYAETNQSSGDSYCGSTRRCTGEENAQRPAYDCWTNARQKACEDAKAPQCAKASSCRRSRRSPGSLRLVVGRLTDDFSLFISREDANLIFHKACSFQVHDGSLGPLWTFENADNRIGRWSYHEIIPFI